MKRRNTFLRLYVTEFLSSSGKKIYGGKRHSPYKNFESDPYVGSGVIIKRAIEKYGKDCVISISWSKPFETPELLKEAEELLIDELKDKYSYFCANLVKGGQGGSYYDKDKNPRVGKKRTKESRNKMSEAAKNRKWTEEGLKRRIEATIKMKKTAKVPDFSGDKNPAAKKIQVGDLIFNTGKECAKYFNICQATVIDRCKNQRPKWKEWRYYDSI
ncbi:putative group I intron endonuclease [Escherichia phage vB_EcoM_G5211]|nr:putative group I intron endonuclease [Escherichia phage vB_EcoM_G37-3]QBO66392.1 putative group I intron endonuclease [Escherichia phage vB_EcoM_G5211]